MSLKGLTLCEVGTYGAAKEKPFSAASLHFPIMHFPIMEYSPFTLASIARCSLLPTVEFKLIQPNAIRDAMFLRMIRQTA
jgi:hypothetical protein